MRWLQNDRFRTLMVVLAFLLGFILTGALFLHPHKWTGTGEATYMGTAARVSK
jgi:hypothetical protein